MTRKEVERANYEYQQAIQSGQTPMGTPFNKIIEWLNIVPQLRGNGIRYKYYGLVEELLQETREGYNIRLKRFFDYMKRYMHANSCTMIQFIRPQKPGHYL